MTKVPVMLWIAVSFLPWILYWVLSGQGNPAGVGLALLASGGLAATSWGRRRLYLMDGVTFCFFDRGGGNFRHHCRQRQYRVEGNRPVKGARQRVQ